MRANELSRTSPNHTLATLACTAASIVLVNELLKLSYNPDLARANARTASTIVPFLGVQALPEPLEQLQFAVLVPTGLILLFLFATVFWAVSCRRIPPDVRPRWFVHVPAWVLGLVALAALWRVCEKDHYYYVQHSMPHRSPWFHLLVVLPLAFWAYHGKSALVWRWAFWLVRPCIVLIVSWMAIANSFFAPNASPTPYHLNPLVYPIALLRNGVPIGEDVLSLYGLNATFVAPLVGWLGGGINAVYFAYAILIVITYGALLFVVSWVIKNPFLRICVAFALPYLSYLHIGSRFDPYFQYAPIRMLFPALVLAVLAWSVRHDRHQRTTLGLAAGLAVTGLSWNVDSGAACILSVLAFAAIRIPFQLMRGDVPWWSVAEMAFEELIVPMLCGALAAVALFFGIYWIQVGSWPHFLVAIANTRTLAETGYSFLPLPEGLSFWHVFVLTSGACVVSSFRLFINRRDRLACFHVAVAVMSLALLVYYIGRSHESTLFGPLWIAPLALGLIAERLDETLRGTGPLVFGRVVHLVILAYLVSAPVACTMNLAHFWRAGRARYEMSLVGRHEPSRLGQAADFVKTHSDERTKVMIFAVDEDGPLYLLSRRKPAIEMSSSTDLLFRKENARIVDYLQSNVDTPVFVLDGGAPSRSPDISGVLSSLYRPATVGPGITLLKRKTGS